MDGMNNRAIYTIGIFAVLFLLTCLGIGILVWLSPISEDNLTPAQRSLLDIGDWMVKATVGAILGFTGGAGLVKLGGNGKNEHSTLG